jgi:hypothetical protein
MLRMADVMRFLDLNEIKQFIDPKADAVMRYLLKKVLFSQPELLPEQASSNIQMTKEFLEQWIAQALNLKKVASGNYPIDVYDSIKKIGIDIKFVSATSENGKFSNGISNETSLAQNFADEGNDLDQLFKIEDYNEILKKWVILLTRKMKKAIDDLVLKKIYYFVFIRGGNAIYLAIAEIYPENLTSLIVDYGGKKSVFIKHFSPDRYGQVKIYKSKKRMELRTYALNLYNDNKLVVWDFSKTYNPKRILLRDAIENSKKFRKYVQKELVDIFLTDL